VEAISTEDRIVGCLLGGALGDAWGGPFEGATSPVHFEIPTQSALSDDTQLTLATCESILERCCVDPENIASHFLRWFREGRIHGIGSSTLKAMRDLAAGVHWALAGGRGEYSAGNGAAMRIAPLAFLLNTSEPGDRSLIRDVCRITHHNDEAYVGALAIVMAIRSVIEGTWPRHRNFLDVVVNSIPDSAVRDRVQQLLPLRLSAIEVASHFGATGYVVDTVPLALYCAQSIAAQPLQAVRAETIGAGGDTDTIASIAGQLAGAVVGAAGIPDDVFARIKDSDQVRLLAQEFAKFIATQGLYASPPSTIPTPPTFPPSATT
jgi:ADP-ribosyl-[dinitrogen reductase] hydrolase